MPRKSIFPKLLEKGFTLAVAEKSDSVRFLPETNIDKETGEIIPDELEKEREKSKAFDKDALCSHLELFDSQIILA